MRLRPYRKSDFTYLQKWVTDVRTHALWSADSLSFPLTEESLQDLLKSREQDFGACGYTFTEDKGQPVGFLIYSINEEENYGFVSCAVVDDSLRGKGYGRQMMELALRYAFTITNVADVRLNVFDANERARKCYEKVGFSEMDFQQDDFVYAGETWRRIRLKAKREH